MLRISKTDALFLVDLVNSLLYKFPPDIGTMVYSIIRNYIRVLILALVPAEQLYVCRPSTPLHHSLYTTTPLLIHHIIASRAAICVWSLYTTIFVLFV
jgi:hypothetical protein